MKKRIFSCLFVLALLLSLLPGIPAQADSGEIFAGSRTVSFTMDSSDVENFYDGGMSALNLKLRRHAPSWLEFDMDTVERNIVLTLRVPFTSFEDYQNKMDTLVDSVACILHKQEGGLVLVEDFLPIELLNFLHEDAQEAQKLGKWVQVAENRLTLNNQDYDFADEKLRIDYDPAQQMPFRNVEIQTWHTESGGLVRTVELTVEYSFVKDPRWIAIRERCESLGKIVDEGYAGVSLTVELQADTHEALTQMTAQCMDSVVRYKQRASIEGDMVKVQWTERFFVEGKFKEYGLFDYVYTLPESMDNAVALSPETEISEGKVDAYRQYLIQVEYQTPYTPGADIPGIDTSNTTTLCIQTDASSPFRRIRRNITLTAPVQQAQGFHEELKNYLAERMVKGTTLEIYDENGTRYYVLSFSSWFWKDIEEFSAPYVQSKIDCADSWIPMGESTFKESFGKILPGFPNSEHIKLDYQFPGDSQISCNGLETTITYRTINPFKTALEVLGVVALVTIIVLCVRGGRRKKTADTAPEMVETPAETPQRCCVACGAPVEAEDMFCPSCGHPQT